MKEAVQHPGEVYYNPTNPPLETAHEDPAGRAVTSVESQVRGHFQQTLPMKWVHQDSVQPARWTQGIPDMANWGQNFNPYRGGMNEARGQMAYPKMNHEGDALQREKTSQVSSEVYKDVSQSQMRGLEWEQHQAAMLHTHLQGFQPGHKPADLQCQPHAISHTMQGSMLQPFQLAFGSTKQPVSSGFYQVFPSNTAMPTMGYTEQPKSQHHLQQQMQQHQLQQQQHVRQHLQQQHQIQQHQIQQQQLQQMQYQQQKLHEMQQMHQLQQQKQMHMQAQPKPLHLEAIPVQTQEQELQPPSFQSNIASPPLQENQPQDPGPVLLGTKEEESMAAVEPPEPPAMAQVLPRRSRRLSKDGLSPVATVPSSIPWNQMGKDPHNGADGPQGPAGGVIQSTPRRRRASKEINLETLAQKASEMESLPAKVIKDEGKPGWQAHGSGMVPLVIPVSVPVRRGQVQSQADPTGSWPHGRPGGHDLGQHQYKAENTPSVIVARRRSLKNSVPDSPGLDDDEPKSKRRPRPEPLFIPPPKPSTFIAPSVYSSITPYQSHLRSPIRLPDHPLTLPPYTPPPILSPVREGSGLYFSTFLSNIASGTQSLPPPPTRSLLRSSSSDITPPVLPPIGEATPVSLEPRINIGPQYQAEIPEMRDLSLGQHDLHLANLVSLPLPECRSSPGQNDSVDNLMSAACSSVFTGGGTNQELALHCLYECGGDIMATLEMLLLKNPVFAGKHSLADYHYSGSDSWSQAEKRYFNKGIAAYRKDFFMVQKLVQSKSVAQCVEFYYTYKKQVKIGRNGALTYGPPDPEEQSAERYEAAEEGHHNRKWEESHDPTKDENQVSVTQTRQGVESTGPVLVLKEERDNGQQEETPRPAPPPLYSPPQIHKPHPEPTSKKSRAPAKSSQEHEGVFPCKKCSRVFYKVKSRSAHMKSHAEQEKKAAAQRQREEEEERAAAAIMLARRREEEQARLIGEDADRDEQGESSDEAEDDDDEDWQ
ncbi:mitotic deacetylase associated SANT domain protein a isoform X1 [Denticeps clupeoides]|uniref:mitotic deacetylase associated SANT domain protein a isoform X1 n=1 Tax=Denticeps clupeoides TaxID=299321 RepID=UPI0010A30081|nr:ELM2 and SANT domain-containing protein 1-like isoform X1 [Denticeps clupeoides]